MSNTNETRNAAGTPQVPNAPGIQEMEMLLSNMKEMSKNITKLKRNRKNMSKFEGNVSHCQDVETELMLSNKKLLNDNTTILSRMNEDTYEKYLERAVMNNRSFFMATGTLEPIKSRNSGCPRIEIRNIGDINTMERGDVIEALSEYEQEVNEGKTTREIRREYAVLLGVPPNTANKNL
jgi:hypothetical protein